MIRRLASCSLALLLLTGCVSTGNYYYPDNSYYEPADDYYGDYYYAPEDVDYDYYYDDPGYGFWRLDRYRCSFYGTCWSYGLGAYGGWPRSGWSFSWYPVGYYGGWSIGYGSYWPWYHRSGYSHWHDRGRDHDDRSPPVTQPDRDFRRDLRRGDDWRREQDNWRGRPRPPPRGPDPDRALPEIERRGPERDRYQPPASERRPERELGRSWPAPEQRETPRRPAPVDGDYRDRSRPLLRDADRTGPAPMPRQSMERPPMQRAPMQREPMQREPMQRQPERSARNFDPPPARAESRPAPEPARERDNSRDE